jgi:signal transduction histidine kinase
MKLNIIKDKFLWVISLLITIITFLHYSDLMAVWELHIFYRKLYYIPIILASFRYRLKGGLVASIIISILYAPHIIFFNTEINIALINQYLEIMLFLSIGVITGWLVEGDYKKQKLLEKNVVEITKLQNYTRNIVDSIDSGVLATDINLDITALNKEGEKILGVQDVIGVSVSTIFDNIIIDILNQTKLQKIRYLNAKTIIKVGSEEKYLKLTVSPLLNILNKIQGLVIVIQDYSSEKYLEAQTARADRLSAVGELASGIAHEIRNPMGIIKTISQTLQSEDDHESIVEGLAIIVKEIDRANKVIQTLLNFARPDTNIIEEVNVNELVEEVLLIINKYANKKNIEIHFKNDKAIIIQGDKEKLKQVFINIILNSIQSMEDGGLISINTEASDSGVNISFKDTGIGITKENLSKIFNPFFTTKEQGTGLGLAVSNRIIQDHNGYITIDSAVNKGTMVVLYLPVHE